MRSTISNLSRAKIQRILEDYGFAVYDNELTDELREALEENILDGTIPDDALY